MPEGTWRERVACLLTGFFAGDGDRAGAIRRALSPAHRGDHDDDFPEPNPAEKEALFRLGLVGDLLARDLSRGELEVELKDRAARHYLPPGSDNSRKYHWKTLQTWYYLARHKGLAGLIPHSRRRGHASASPSGGVGR